ncbi:ADP-ribosylation factor-like protein 13B isoform X2 [Haemaphysalis longicornis]
MGARLCRRKKKNITLLMIGLDNAGKTSTTKHLLKEGNPGDVVPTVGFSSVETERCGFRVTLCDLGGGPRIRAIWERYYALAHGLVLVVDASAAHRAPECRAAVEGVLADPRVAGKPLLVLLNKQDLENAVDEIEMCSLLDLENTVNQHKCPTRVENCCAIKFGGRKRKRDPGIDKGFHWLLGHIARNLDELQARVDRDAQLQQAAEKREQEERLARVQRARELRAAKETLKQNGQVLEEEEEGDRNGNNISRLQCKPEEVATVDSHTADEELKGRVVETPDGARLILVSPVQQQSGLDGHGNDNNELCSEEMPAQNCRPPTPLSRTLGLSLYISESSCPPLTEINM